MTARRWLLVACAGMFPLLAASLGCLKRTEKITITPDGAVRVAIQYEGEKQDFETLDALPSEHSGWKVTRETEKDKDREIVTLRSERTFAAREDLPVSFAPANDPNADLALRFPTTLQRERRPDGVYLHFRRVYEPRAWRFVDFWSEAILDDNVKKLLEKKPEELSAEERVQLIKAMAWVEAMKQTEFARMAIKQADADIKPDHWLTARAAQVDVYENQTDWEGLAERFAAFAVEERDVRAEEEFQRILDHGHRALVDALRKNAKYDETRLAKFEAAFERVKRGYEITNQTGGHAFDIRVTMPGEVVAHNGDKVEDGAVVWQFDGKAFRDRPYELMVTSRLPLGREDRE